jgi:GNAT superfamily N-acetyltransferase
MLQPTWSATGASIAIRRARPDEAPTLTAIALAAKAHWGYAAAQIERWRPVLEVTAGQLATQPAFVAACGSAVGFYSLLVDAAVCELDNLWVLPQHMGRGIGRRLLDHAMQTARDLGITTIQIDADPFAAAFYEKCGAVLNGTVPAPIDGDPQRVRPQLRLATSGQGRIGR